MLKKGDWLMIRAQAERGVYLKDIAAELGVHPRTVSRALARGDAPVGKRRRPKFLKLEAFMAQIDQLLRDGVWNGRVILKEIQAKGYQGGATTLREYMQPKRALRVGRPTVRFETAPGKQLQLDWGEIRRPVAGREQKICFAVSTLGYSRRQFFWCTDREDAEHSYEGLILALEHFGGVPAEVLVDNQKPMVAERLAGGGARFTERFLDLAGHYGFTPRACRPYRARTKGKDERSVGYIKGNFFQRYREFESLEHANALAVQWLAEEADVRVHGTVKEIVAERFAREAPHLRPLPASRYDTSYREQRWVSWDSYIDVRGNRYSVPGELCGQPVSVRISLDGRLRVYADDALVMEHQLRPTGEGWVTVPAHHAELWRQAVAVQRRDLAVYAEVTGCN